MAAIGPLADDSVLMQLRAAGAERTLNQTRPDLRHDSGSDDDLKRVSQQFESLLLHFMVREMRATVPESALFPPSMADQIYTGMLDEHLAQEMANNGGIGIARMIFNQLKADPNGRFHGSTVMGRGPKN